MKKLLLGALVGAAAIGAGLAVFNYFFDVDFYDCDDCDGCEGCDGCHNDEDEGNNKE